MEGRARQLLEPCLLGQAVNFNPEEQLFIAGWATKIAMVGEVIMDFPDSFTEADRRLVRQQQRPPSHAGVYLAVYDGPYLTTCYF
ncbi:MAG: hypothetical protein WAM97_15065, partial [Acidimicrobiales bacterium]